MRGIIRDEGGFIDWTGGKFKLQDVSQSQTYADAQFSETHVSIITDPLEEQTFIL